MSACGDSYQIQGRVQPSRIQIMSNPKSTPQNVQFYTVPEAAMLLRVSTKTVYRLLHRGILKAPSAVRHKRITAASVESFAGTAH
jgi:excisionase family DNA binding protein